MCSRLAVEKNQADSPADVPNNEQIMNQPPMVYNLTYQGIQECPVLKAPICDLVSPTKLWLLGRCLIS
jgi:hypothetical protein